MLRRERSVHRPLSNLALWLYWSALTFAGGLTGNIALLALSSFRETAFQFLGISLLLALPIFTASLGQWLLLRTLIAPRFDRWTPAWLLTGGMGIWFVSPFLFFYGFADEYSGGQSLIFWTSYFWVATGSLTIMALAFGACVGLFQGLLVIRGYGEKRRRVFWWVCASAIGWGAGYPLGLQFVAALYRLWKLDWHSFGLLVWLGIPWLVIGMVTGIALVWLRGSPVPARSPVEAE